MKGIYFGDFLLKQLEVLLVFAACAIYFLPPLYTPKAKMNSSEIVKPKSKLQIRDIIQLSVLICMFIGVALAIQNIKSNVISLCIIIFMGLFCLIAFLGAIVEFTKYIILKSSEFELTEDKENVIWLIVLQRTF